MSLSGRISDQAFNSTKTFCKGKDLKGIQQVRNFFLILNFKGDHSTFSRVEDFLDLRGGFQKLDYLAGILCRALHPDRERLETTDQQIAVKRGKNRTCRVQIVKEFVIQVCIICHDNTSQDIIVTSQVLGC